MATIKSALEGIRVLDLGRNQAAPRVGSMLARLGAEVIKVEGLAGEDGRNNGPIARGQSVYFVQYNNGKKSLAMDLRKEKGKEILRELVKISDIFIQNFRPGIIDVMGFSYEVLHGLNPKIIMLNISAYGQYGSYRERAGLDTIGQAIGGLMSITGHPGNPPSWPGSAIIDNVTALNGTIGVLAALRELEVSGEGQAIDVCLSDSGFLLTEIPVVDYLETGNMAGPMGAFYGRSFAGIFKAADGWVCILASPDNVFRRFCECIGKPEWIKDPRFINRRARAMNLEILQEELTKWCSTRTMEDVVGTLSDAGVPCVPVNNIAQAARSPMLWERECLVKVPDPIAGTIHVAGNYVKLSRSQATVGPAPALGEHTDKVLSDLLNYTPEQLQRLREEEVIK
ncbi:CaiB/BaiF CoA transferase family protein [Chloroflexota bacterium]